MDEALKGKETTGGGGGGQGQEKGNFCRDKYALALKNRPPFLLSETVRVGKPWGLKRTSRTNQAHLKQSVHPETIKVACAMLCSSSKKDK